MDKVDRNTGVRFERLRFGEAIIGALPFLVFGIVFAADQIELPFPSRYLYLAFYLLVLVGLGAGLVMSFPLWAYSYLGWTLMITLDGMMHWGPGGSCLEAITGGSWQSWVPFGIVVLVGLLWARSLEPLKNVFTGIWKDWTHLSLVLFAAGGWMAKVRRE